MKYVLNGRVFEEDDFGNDKVFVWRHDSGKVEMFEYELNDLGAIPLERDTEEIRPTGECECKCHLAPLYGCDILHNEDKCPCVKSSPKQSNEIELPEKLTFTTMDSSGSDLTDTKKAVNQIINYLKSKETKEEEWAF